MDDNPPSTNSDTKVCPYCAETIKAAAVVCRYCGKGLPPAVIATSPSSSPPVNKYDYRFPADTAPAPKLDENGRPVYQGKKASCGTFIWAIALVFGVILAMAFINLLSMSFSSRTVSVSASTPTPLPTATMTAAQLQMEAVAIPWDDLARNTEAHVGKLMAASGTIVQVLEDGDEAQLWVNIDGDYGQTVYVIYPGYSKARVLEDDKIKMIARVDGRLTYKSTLGQSITLPQLTANWLEVVKGK